MGPNNGRVNHDHHDARDNHNNTQIVNLAGFHKKIIWWDFIPRPTPPNLHILIILSCIWM